MGKEPKIDEGEKEKVYEVVSREGEATVAKLMSELGLGELKIQRCLEALYGDGLIDWVGRDRRRVRVVEERRVKEAYLKRNIDLAYIKKAVKKGVVDSLLAKELGPPPEPAEKTEPAPDEVQAAPPTVPEEKVSEARVAPAKEEPVAGGEGEFAPLADAAIGRMRELRSRGEDGLAGLQKNLENLDALYKTLLEVLELRAEYEKLLATKLEKAGLKR
ncbi:MAG: hypothetical protein AABX40_08820 [Candidatus Hydrothermarchaeota archaeon]